MLPPKIKYAIPYGENAFGILGGFKRAALQNGWSAHEISEVLAEATAGSYEELISTIEKHTI